MIAQRTTEECEAFTPNPDDEWGLAQSFGLSSDNLAFAYRVPITQHTEIQGSVYFTQGVFPDALHWTQADGRISIPQWLCRGRHRSGLGRCALNWKPKPLFRSPVGFSIPFANANNPLEVTGENKSQLFFVDLRSPPIPV